MTRARFIVRLSIDFEVFAETMPDPEDALAYAEVVAGQALVQRTENEARVLTGRARVRRAKPAAPGGRS